MSGREGVAGPYRDAPVPTSNPWKTLPQSAERENPVRSKNVSEPTTPVESRKRPLRLGEEDIPGPSSKRSRVEQNEDSSATDPEKGATVQATSPLHASLPPPSTVLGPLDVNHPRYQSIALRANGINFNDLEAGLPPHIAAHIERMQALRASPEPIPEEHSDWIDQLARSRYNGCNHVSYLANLLGGRLLEKSGKRLTRSHECPMAWHLVPDKPDNGYTIARPVPTCLIGYNTVGDTDFTRSEVIALGHLRPQVPDFVVPTGAKPNRPASDPNAGLLFPYLSMDFVESYGRHSDTLAAAEDRGHATSTACVAAVEQLNTAAKDLRVTVAVGNWTYGVAGTCEVAELYITWKGSPTQYSVHPIGQYTLDDRGHLLKLRNILLNIIDWPCDTRVKQIKDVLAVIIEERQKSPPCRIM